MRPGWKIGQLAGIGVFVHWSFFILPAWVLFATFSAGGSLGAAVTALLFVAGVFGCIVLHEMGHALSARMFGIDTQDITLYPIGGVARLDRIPRNPGQELVIALAGPAVNVVIAAVLFAFLGIGAATTLPTNLMSGSLLVNLFWANVILVAFNLLPAFPMDGGRVLRAILAWLMPYERATTAAARIGQFVAILFALGGFVTGSLSLMIVGFFVFMAAQAELARVRFESAKPTWAQVVDADQHRTRPEPPPGYAYLNESGEWLDAGNGDIRVIRVRTD